MLLPYITNQNKKFSKAGAAVATTIPQQIYKQWSQTKKQLQSRIKLFLPKLQSLVQSSAYNDFNKICKIKQIPEYYSNFLFLTLQKQTPQYIQQILNSQIRQIINNRSFYHKILEVLQTRLLLIKDVQKNIEITEGFIHMNAGKSIKSTTKSKINQLLKDATTLDDIKNIQKQIISQLASSIIKVRNNSRVILQCVKQWRQNLIKNVISPANPNKRNKVRIMFPYLNINCVLLPLYDQESILSSFLSRQFSISRENNPFILIGKDINQRRKSQFQQYFRQQINKDQKSLQQYNNLTMLILAELPVKQDPDQKARQQQERIRQKEEQKLNKLKELKEKQKMKQKQIKQKQRLKQKQLKQKQKLKQRQLKGKQRQLKEKQRQSSNKNTQRLKSNSLKKQSKSVIDVESILLKHKQRRKNLNQNQNNNELEQNNTNRPNSMENRGVKQQVVEQNVKDTTNKRNKKIVNIYGNRNANKYQQKGPISEPTVLDEKIVQIINEKQTLEKELKQAKTKNKQFQKLIKKLEKQQKNYQSAKTKKQRQTPVLQMNFSMVDNKSTPQVQKQQFQNKVQAIYSKKHQKRISNTSIKQKEGQKQKQVQTNVDKNIIHQLKEKSKQKQKKIEKNLENSQKSIQDLLNDNKSLQKQLKSQIRQKEGLQKSLKKSQNEAGKQVQKYKKQKEKYEQKIEQLKSKLSLNQISPQNKQQQQKLKRSRSPYQNLSPRSQNKSPKMGQNQQKLMEQKQQRLSLQNQIKDLMKEKDKLQRVIEKSQKQMGKQLQKRDRQKQKYQQKLQMLQSKVSSSQNSPKNKEERDKIKRQRASVFSVYLNQSIVQEANSQVSANNLFQSKLNQQRQARLSLQKQIKQLIKQKTKLQKTIQKSQNQVVKQKQNMERKFEKYELAIQKLKQQKSELTYKKVQSKDLQAIEGKAIDFRKKRSQSLRMYTTTPIKTQQKDKSIDKKQYSKNNSIRKDNKHVQSANYFKLPPQIKKAKLRQKTIDQKDEYLQQQKNKNKQNANEKKMNKVEIIQTKKTIQIIYEGASRRKNKNQKQKGKQGQKAQLQFNEQLEKLKKQKQNLIVHLQRQKNKKQQQQKAKQRKALKQEGQIQKYKQIIQQQRQKKNQLETKIRNLKKQLFQEFEQRLRSQKIKFHEQKKQLIQAIQLEKSQKQLKQKYLNNQIKFLKQMQANQNQLIKLLQQQKKNRLQKQKQLAAQIEKKQELLQILQIEQIKKGLEKQIRQQLDKKVQEEQQEDENFQNQIQERKQELRLEIQEMNNEKNMQLQQIDEQNQRLKALISRIKDQQAKLISAIKQNIQEQQQDQKTDQNNDDQNQKRYHSAQLQLQKSRVSLQSNIKYNQFSDIQQPNHKKKHQLLIDSQTKEPKKDEKLQINDKNFVNLEETQRIFKSRLRAQQQHQVKMNKEFQNMRQSPQYRQKQEVQNLIQMYLKDPHEYLPNKKSKKDSNLQQKKSRDYSPQQKQQLKEDILKKSKMAGDFQRQLLKLKQVQKFVPTSEDDIMTSHLLSLKRVYQQKQSSALKQQLFPAIKQDQDYHDHELSFQSEQIQPKTLRDHVQVHAKKFKKPAKNNSKNFLTINRMRVAMLEENRKQKQKQLIEQEAKRRAQAQILKKILKSKQQQRMRKEEQNKKKLQQDLSKLKKQNQQSKNKARKKRTEEKSRQLENSSQKSKSKSKSKQKLEGENKQKTIKIKNKKQNQVIKLRQINQNQKQQSQKQLINLNQDEKIDKQEQDNNEQLEQNQQELKDFDTQNMYQTNNHTSLQKQRKQLQQDIFQYQQQIRSYVSRDEKYELYQHFVQSSQITSYLQNILNISSQQVRGLNNNPTLFKDILSYRSVLILVAKDGNKDLQIGIAILHKEPLDGLYTCDYVLAHNMKNFLNLLFNISRYIFKLDLFTNKIQFYFNLSKLEDQMSIINFIQFEQKCKRMGQVYIKVGSDKTRKYVLRRNLFQPVDKQFQTQGKGISFSTSIQIHSDLIKQKGYGYQNKKNTQYFSATALLAYYMKNNDQVLNVFRKNSEDDLKYRQLLLTTLMFEKKQVQLKNCSKRQLGVEERLQISKKFLNSFTIEDPTHSVQELKFDVQNILSDKTRRCTFQIEGQEVNYIIYPNQEAVTKIQSTNSSQVGIFMSLIPKYKMLIIEASQFITMHKANPQVNVFFYIKHFIKNISQVTKQQHPKIFIPEVMIENQVFHKELSDRMKVAVFAKENVRFGWSNVFSNSIIFTPFHKDLVIKKPFIISLMSAAVERVIQGTPLMATLIQ